MLENIELKKFPRTSGVYMFKDLDGVVIYVGSSKDLYNRMNSHRNCIKKGYSKSGCIIYLQDFYQFLQNNQFSVQFQLEENYLQLEQQLIEKYNPKFNKRRAFTGCGI